MNYDTIKVCHNDGHEILVSHDLSVSTKKANVLLLHGMAEHHKRYDNFSLFLTTQGYDVYRYSHRGHGTHLKTSELGSISDRNGAQLVVEDAICVLREIHRRDADTPTIVFGHSMGSFIARNLIQQYDQIDGIILCGTANPPNLITMGGLFIAILTGCYLSPKKKSPIMDKLVFGSSKYKKLNTRTNFDWLTTDTAEVDRYIEDEFCGFICSKSFYKDLLLLIKRSTGNKSILKIPKTIPIFILSGAQDPVGNYGIDITRLINFFSKHGYTVTSKLYPGMRHELLNEQYNDNVMKDISMFLEKALD